MIGEVIRSPIFIIDCCEKSKNKWQLLLYPKDDTEDTKKYISVFLEHLIENENFC